MSVMTTAGILLGLQASLWVRPSFAPAVRCCGPGSVSLSCCWPSHGPSDWSPEPHVQVRLVFSVGPGQAPVLPGCTSILSVGRHCGASRSFPVSQQGIRPEGIPISTSGVPGCAAWWPPSRPCAGDPFCMLWGCCGDTHTADTPLGVPVGSVETRPVGGLSPSRVSEGSCTFTVGISGLSPAPGTPKPSIPLRPFSFPTFPQGSPLSGAGLVSEPRGCA